MKPILFVYSALIFSLLKTDWALGKQSEILFENGHYKNKGSCHDY